MKRRPPVDWDRIKRQLAAAEDALAKGFAPTPERRREILHARARALARVPATPVRAADGIDVIEFMLAQERYAFAAACVREVQPLKDLTGVPCTPRHVSGIINAHGRILTVIDLKKFFELTDSGLSDLNKVIVLQHRDVAFGILADSIVGAAWVPLADLQASLPTLTGIRAEYLKGITSQRVIVLDAIKLLTDAALTVDEEVTPAG
ncbi:MAG: chemotaxis protein CheW [Betaproteobacteria bacterium]|nr:MAG: chemotaxis protein CheW [Betaproteobacteria bacterium]TMH35294.1 MAG: chemotaxis protein CheW [Betaproteobacteria bacterium]